MLKIYFFLVLLISPIVSLAAALPSEPGMKVQALPVTKQGKQIKVRFSAVLPATQKLNPGAPSYFAIFEKVGTEWNKVKEIKLSGLPAFGDVIELNEVVNFAEEKSEIAVHSTLYHCGKDKKTACYIQGFQGKSKRGPSGAESLTFYAYARVDKY